MNPYSKNPNNLPPTLEEQEAKVKKEAEAKKRKEDQLKKEAAQKIPQKSYYDVKVECMLPATLTWRVLADDPHQAIALTRGVVPQTVKHRLIGRKELKVMVYDAGSTFLKLIKNMIG
jgi:hypothetical protein